MKWIKIVEYKRYKCDISYKDWCKLVDERIFNDYTPEMIEKMNIPEKITWKFKGFVVLTVWIWKRVVGEFYEK